MKKIMNQYVCELMERYPVLTETEEAIKTTYNTLVQCYEAGGKLLIAGNGGSASDAEHMVGELMKGFVLPRRVGNELRDKLILIGGEMGADLADKLQEALPAIALSNHNSLSTAIINDIDGNVTFAQQLYGYGNEGDVFFAISTSGNSHNILQAATVAKAKGLKVIGLTGKTGGKLAGLADTVIKVPETETYKIQELHLPVYHCLCMMLERYFFGSFGQD